MAGSDVEICNRALDLLGAGPIVSLSDASVAARLCSRNYGPARDTVLRLYPWNDATARASLAADPAPPAFGFAYAYNLPPDCLRVVEINGEQLSQGRWRVEGRQVLTHAGAPLQVRYIRRLDEPGLIGPLLAECIAAQLAAQIAFAITNASSMAQTMVALRNQALREARQIDALEQSQDEALTSDDWVVARYTGYGPVR